MFFFSPPSGRSRGVALSRKGFGADLRQNVPFSCVCSLRWAIIQGGSRVSAFFPVVHNLVLCYIVLWCGAGALSGSPPLLVFCVGGVSRVVFPVCFSFVCSAVFWLVVAGVVSRSCWRGGRGSRRSCFRLAAVVVGRPRSCRRRRFVRRCLRRRPFALVPSLPSSVVGSSLRLAAGAAVVGVVRLSPLVLFPLALCPCFGCSRLARFGRLVVGCSGCCRPSVGRAAVRVGAAPLCPRWLRLVAALFAAFGRRWWRLTPPQSNARKLKKQRKEIKENDRF